MSYDKRKKSEIFLPLSLDWRTYLRTVYVLNVQTFISFCSQKSVCYLGWDSQNVRIANGEDGDQTASEAV